MEEQLFKIVITGNSAVGKSSLLLRFCDDTFKDVYLSTIGVDFRFKTLQVEGQTVKLQIWDTAGQERFRTITSSYYKGAQGIVLVYDVKNRKTFEDIERHWLKEIKNFGDNNVQIMLLGNKSDLISEENAREVQESEIQKLCEENNMKHFEVSAKTAEQVHQAFDQFSKQILQKWQETPQEDILIKKPLDQSQNQKNSNGCC